MRKLLIGLVVLVVILVGAAFAGPLFVPTDSIKQDIAREVAKATGRDLAIDGNLKFRVLPAPGVSATAVRLSNADTGSAPDMLKLESAAVEVALFPLITGKIQVTRIVLSSPQILLEQYADGTNNWTFTPETPAGAETAAGADAGGSEDGTSGAPPVRLDDVIVESGTLVFRTPDQTERIEDINVSLGAGSLQGPFRAAGALEARGFQIGLDAAIGALAEDKATPVNLKVSTGGAEIAYSGVLAGAPDAARLSGQLEVRAADLSALIATLTDGPAPTALRGKSLEIDGNLAASEAALSINDLALRLGEDSATGAVDVTLGDEPAANLVLNLPQLDLDRLLAASPADGTPPTASTAGDGGGSTARAPAAVVAAPGGGFAIPTGLKATLETKIDAVVYRGGVIRQVLLNTQLEDGSINVSQAAAQLPGGASASLVGFVSAEDAGPRFEGQAELSADDFRALLQWAGVDVAGVPQDRLRKMAGSLAVSATPENVTLTDVDFSVDVSRLRGGIAIALRERPGFGIGLSLDKVNLDAYLPAEAATASAPAATPGEAAPATPANASPQAGAGLAALDAFDAILQLKVGEVVFREQRLAGINIDGTLQGGELELRDASVSSLAGAKASVRGRINELSAAPKADVVVNLEASNGDRLLALAGVKAPVRVGAAKLNGSLRGDMQDLAVDVTLDALGARLKTAGTLGVLSVPPRYDVKLDLAHPNAAAFLARVQGSAPPFGKNPGALALSTSARGNLSATEVDARIGLGPGTITAQGNLANLASGSPTGTVALKASHPDTVSFVRVFAPDYRPALADLGPFALDTNLTLSPTSMGLADLNGKAGPVSFRGTADVATGGVRPNVVAELTTSEIIVDWFLPAPSGAAQAQRGGSSRSTSAAAAPARPAGERWSREPIDVSGLRAADADIKLSAPAITYTDIRVDDPRVAVVLKDGVLDLTQLSGNAFGGGFNMTAQLAARDIPTMRYKMNVDGADAAKFVGGGASGERGVMSVLDLLFPVSDVTLASGKLGADLDVTSRGRSEFEMISNLAGKGAMRFTDAVVEGINVCEISDQLDRLNGIESFLGLAGAGRGGQTRIANFNGRFDLAKGIATLPQQQINAECAAVAFRGTTNLPAWLVDIQARAGFPAHPEFPGVVIEQKGPLDAPNTRLVNVNQINEFIVGKAAGSVLRKLLPGGDQQSAPSSGGDTSQPQSNKPEDQFRNLLEGLIRRR